MKTSNKINFIAVCIAALALGGFFGAAIFAQENPPAAPEIPSAPPAGVIPTDNEFQNFQEETGFEPDEYLKEAEPERPKFEEPGKIPDEVRQYVSDKDIVEIYCATVRWKSGGFFTAMDAIKKHLVRPLKKQEIWIFRLICRIPAL